MTDAIRKGLQLGLMLCACENEWQMRLASRLAETIPCIDLVRSTLTGTETTYYVVKLARECTGRTLVAKFEEHFHGFNDYLAYSYWPNEGGLWPKVTPAVDGLPEYLIQGFLVLPFDDFTHVEQIFRERGSETVNDNSGTILPKPGFLGTLRRLTTASGALLIFYEILSGFPTGLCCMQTTYGVTPDLCTLAKAIRGGTPLSLFGGRQDIMEHLPLWGKPSKAALITAISSR